MKQINIEEYNIKKVMQNASAPEYLDDRISQVLQGISEDAGTASADTLKFAGAGSRRRWHGAKIAAVAACAVLVIGGTVFAATGLIDFRIDRNDAYSVNVAADVETASAAETASAETPSEVPEVKITVGYMTPGMDENYKGDYSYASLDSDFGYFISELYMDEGGSFAQDFVTDSETFMIGERTAAYVSRQTSVSDPDWEMKDLYLSFPEFNRIVCIQGWGYAEKAELMKIAEGIEVEETGTMIPYKKLATWSNFKAYKNGELTDIDTASYQPVTSASEADMAALHQIGDTFPLYKTDFSENPAVGAVTESRDLSASVADVQVADDLSLLTAEWAIEDAWKDLLNEDGSLKEGTRQYIRAGNGTDSLNEVIRTETEPLKLVYLTVNYTNTGDADQENVWFHASLLGLEKDSEGYHIFDDESRASSGDFEYDTVTADPLVGFGEMWYYDLHGGERNNNYIPLIRAGETETVHLAWIIPENDLDKMYLNLANGSCELTADVLTTGLVDVRQ